MKLRPISIIVAITAVSYANAMANVRDYSTETEVTVQVREENGDPIEDAEVWVWYSNPQRDLNGEPISGIGLTGSTDEDGAFVSKQNGRAGITTKVKKDGYYPHGYDPAEKDYFGATGMPETLKKDVTLRRVINPTALFAKRTTTIQFPVQGEWIGYDFEQGDLLKPYGEGNKADLLFRYENRFVAIKKAYLEDLERARNGIKRKYQRRGEEFSEDVLRYEIGNWEGVLEVKFPSEKEGILSVVDNFMPQSLLHMPHQAPEGGYEPTHLLETTNYLHQEKQHFTKVSEDMGFFIRTRVILDEDGEIKSANYSKIHGEFSFDPRGSVSFSYYFNPVTNDRNLEFDPKQNLFPEGAPGTFNFVLP